MEGIQTIQALKAVQSSLPAQTTIPSDELVMLYATDGTPIAKISRDDLVKAVASVMASNSQNTFSKLLGVQANGTPMGIGASDLASVLGVLDKGVTVTSSYDFNDISTFGLYMCVDVSGATNFPSSILNNPSVSHGYLFVFGYVKLERPSQIYIQNFPEQKLVMRSYLGEWTNWEEIDQAAIPSFYKNYSDLSSLASALGVQSDYLRSGVTLQKGYGLIIISNISNGTSALFVIGAGTATKITNDDVFVTITKQSEYVTVITPDNPSQSIRYVFITCD